MPHGGTGVLDSAITATARIFLWPSLMALKIATRSAHTVAPKDEFSMLQPEKITPSSVSAAAPTRKSPE
jgi:hypothetical protein